MGDEFDLFWFEPFLLTTSYSACNYLKKDIGAYSVQQWVDRWPASREADDSPTNRWFGPSTMRQTDLFQIMANRAQLTGFGGVCQESEYPSRGIRLAQATLGDAAGGAADSDSFLFTGSAGSNVVIRFAEDYVRYGHETLRTGDVILALSAPGGDVVMKKRGLPPLEFSATLPSSGVYTVTASQRAGSDRAYRGDYRLTVKGGAGELSTNGSADAEACTPRTVLDPELDQPALTVFANETYVGSDFRYGIPGQIGTSLKLGALMVTDWCPDLFSVPLGSLYTCGCSNSMGRTYAMAYGYKKTPTSIVTFQWPNRGTNIGAIVQGMVIPCHADPVAYWVSFDKIPIVP